MVFSEIVLFSLAVLESLPSFYLNVYIMVFHVKILRVGVKLNPPSLIQLVMGVTNISMRGILLINSIALLFPGYPVMRLYHYTMVIIPCHLNFSYWLIAWLCVYYCTTIANIRHQIFIWVKRSLVSFLPLLLFLSMVVSFTLTVQSVWYLHIQISVDNSTHDNIIPKFIFSVSDLNILLLSCLCSCLPFLMTLTSLMVTMSSLVRHIWKVKRNDSGFAPPNLQAHVSAVRTMVSLLVLSIIINAAEIFKLVAMSLFGKFLQLTIWLMVSIFVLSEAAIIIQSSRKLKETFPPMICAKRAVEGHN
ncbi:taste receptor type 2 member 4-like [Mantella aurantiaca]